MAKLDFTKCIFDPTLLGVKKKVQEIFPELSAYKDIPETHIDWQIGICLTDLESPFLKIKDHRQKLDAIYDFFKLNRIKGKDADLYQLVVAYRPCGVMDVCTFMIEYQNHYDFSQWFTKNQSFFELEAVIRKPYREADNNENTYWDRKFKNQERSAKIAAELKDLEVSLFGSVAMKTAAARSKRLKMNYNEKFAEENQVE